MIQIILSRLNFHGDELYPLGGAELGAELGARAISHLEEVRTHHQEDIMNFLEFDYWHLMFIGSQNNT